MDSRPFASRHHQWSFLTIVFLISIFGGLVSHNIVSYFGPQHQTADLIHSSTHLETRNAVLERQLGDLLSGLGSSIEQGVASLLPNTSTILDSLVSLIGGGNGTSIVDSLVTPAKFLGVGLGDGAMTGLNMTGPVNTTVPSGVDGIAQNLGSGLTSSIFSSSAMKSVLSFNSSSLGSTGTIGEAVLALAQGLGGGAASGLNLSSTSSTNDSAAFNTSGISGIAGNFGQGLSSSLLSAVQLPSLNSLMSTGSSVIGSAGNSSFNIAAIGAGLGAGLGQGAAIGLGFQADVASTPTTDTAGITQDFARGLVSSFLQNGTLSKVTSSFSGNSSAPGGLSLSSIDVSKVAEGLAVGMISGAGSTISSLQLIGADTSSFNDSVGGAATGFGRGLGTEGAKLVEDLLAQSSSKAANRRRSFAGPSNVEKSVNLRKRDTASANATDLASVIANLNASTINPLLQTGIDDLTCEGVGGLVGVFLGLVQSKTVSLNALTSKGTSPSTSNTTLNLPDQVFIIRSGGNTYSVNPAKGITTVSINGMAIGSFIGVAAAHIIFAILAYFVAIPLLLLLINTDRFAALFDRRHPAEPSSKWQKYLAYSILPLSILVFAMGIGFRGSGKHFTSAHEILGLIVFLQTLIAAGTTLILK
ncbi:uncharacterized protein LY89DRAFT_58940 [Mollisia scopiformis]|uniref:Cytochrome b561 domain-containing protein n=1 Tax=Mollisia scopiformis TaxID=149040 RepID=A0A194XBY8_MOLSC|nr:uncharacterized protein LY89DRAFT_58940 [Mollisia scopiformis]KUJ17679.1 hypothetical protein LY89DRAFT_58940 [Mollisia scopiformis]